jgi:hypothetical protein
LGRIGGDNVRDCGRRILNALMTTDVAITLNWKGKGVKKSFEALNVCSIVKGKNNSLTSLLLFTISYIVSTNSTQIAYLQSTIIVTRILSENDLKIYSCSIDTNLF